MGEMEFGRGRRALVVDDEVTLAEMIARILDEAGFLVMTLASGRGAALLLRSTQAPPDLLVTDSHMREVSGADLIAVARERFPTLPILFTTGDGGYDPALLRIPPDVVTLYKPFSRDALLQHARQALVAATR
jgi:two-component system, cell cycle sensor histidine kinase and response regulator CckA